jgi:pimeloyl-ACP methyl ester carboxylesterase
MAAPMRSRRLRLGIALLGGAVLLTGTALAGGTLLVETLTRGGDATVIAQQSSTLPTHLLERPDGRIAYDDTGGSGPLVIAVPSLGDLRQEYRFLRPQLVDAGYRVVTMDVRGHGGSSTGWPDYSAVAVGSDIVALADQLQAGRAIVIGTSMAAGAAAWAAAEQPESVAGLVLVGPFVRDIPASPLQTAALKLLINRPWGPAAWSLYYKSLYPTSPPADLTDYRAALKANLKQPGRFDALKQMIWASKAPVEQRLAEVSAPVLVVMGSKDPDFKDPAAEARSVAERLRGTVAIIDGAGHYPHAEMPEQTGATILSFLSSLPLREAPRA